MTMFNVYRRESNDANPTVAIATGLTSMSYSDDTAEKGKAYLYSVGAVKNGLEKTSDEKLALAGTAWTPIDLTNLSKIWINAENVIKDSSNRLSTLINVSDESFNFTQSSDANKPILYNDVDYGFDVIRFDGVNDFFQNTSSHSGELFKNVGSGWCFSVVKRRGVAASGGLFYAPNGTDGSSRFNVNFAGGIAQLSTRRIDRSGTDTLASSINNFTYQMVLLASDFENGKKTIYINGLLNVQKTIDSGLTSNTNGIINSLRIGVASATDAGLPIDADLAELIIGSNSLPTASEIDRLFGWAAHKYGLTDNLPADHLYKILAPTL